MIRTLFIALVAIVAAATSPAALAADKTAPTYRNSVEGYCDFATDNLVAFWKRNGTKVTEAGIANARWMCVENNKATGDGSDN
jgi:hypothetical protein